MVSLRPGGRPCFFAMAFTRTCGTGGSGGSGWAEGTPRRSFAPSRAQKLWAGA